MDYFTNVLVHESLKEWSEGCLVLAGEYLVVTGDFFPWILQDGDHDLLGQMILHLKNIHGFIVYEAWPERLTVETTDSAVPLAPAQHRAGGEGSGGGLEGSLGAG